MDTRYLWSAQRARRRPAHRSRAAGSRQSRKSAQKPPPTPVVSRARAPAASAATAAPAPLGRAPRPPPARRCAASTPLPTAGAAPRTAGGARPLRPRCQVPAPAPPHDLSSLHTHEGACACSRRAHSTAVPGRQVPAIAVHTGASAVVPWTRRPQTRRRPASLRGRAQVPLQPDRLPDRRRPLSLPHSPAREGPSQTPKVSQPSASARADDLSTALLHLAAALGGWSAQGVPEIAKPQVSREFLWGLSDERCIGAGHVVTLLRRVGVPRT